MQLYSVYLKTHQDEEHISRRVLTCNMRHAFLKVLNFVYYHGIHIIPTSSSRPSSTLSMLISLSLSFMSSTSVIISVTPVHKHTQMQPTEPFHVAPVSICLGLTSWDWLTHQGTHPLRRLILALSAATD